MIMMGYFENLPCDLSCCFLIRFHLYVRAEVVNLSCSQLGPEYPEGYLEPSITNECIIVAHHRKPST